MENPLTQDTRDTYEMSHKVYYIIAGTSYNGVTFYYRREGYMAYGTEYNVCSKYSSEEEAFKDIRHSPRFKAGFTNLIDPYTLRILEITENVLVTKTTRIL